jgi:Polyketide cyclase / dehydrase and lipid transport
MTDVTVEQRIAAEPERVAAYAMDPANDTSWIGALTEANVLTEGPVGVGTRVERVASFLGKRIEYINEVEEYDPPRRLHMRSVKAPFPMTVTYEFEPAPGGDTLMRITTGGDASGFYALAGPLLSRQVRRGVARDLERLKEILEG